VKNPFEFGGLVSEQSFCNRKQELADLQTHMKNGTNLFMYGERRTGKTSLAKIAFSRLPKRQYLTVYVDLWPTEDEIGFSAVYAKALAEAFNSKLDDMLEWAKRSVPAVVPTITINDQGQPEFSIGLAGHKAQHATLKAVLDAPHSESMRRKLDVVVVFDEFQQILLYENDYVVRQLRSSIQEHQNVSYIFLGSRKHLIQAMLQDKKQPLYGSGAHYLLGPIATSHWIPFVKEKFAQTGKTISEDVIADICQQTGGHPFYTQHLCNLVWELVPDGDTAALTTPTAAVQLLLERQRYVYETLWESTTQKQKQLLEGIAFEPDAQIFSLEFINENGLGRASTAQAALKKLLQRDLVDRESGSYFITDRFFRLWIRRIAGGARR
jgi:hypothetical protein